MEGFFGGVHEILSRRWVRVLSGGASGLRLSFLRLHRGQPTKAPRSRPEQAAPPAKTTGLEIFRLGHFSKFLNGLRICKSMCHRGGIAFWAMCPHSGTYPVSCMAPSRPRTRRNCELTSTRDQMASLRRGGQVHDLPLVLLPPKSLISLVSSRACGNG